MCLNALLEEVGAAAGGHCKVGWESSDGFPALWSMADAGHYG